MDALSAILAPMTTGSCFTAVAWAAIADIVRAIDEHPFLQGLQAGTLERPVFVRYLAQDSRYLIGYARALASCAAQASDPDDISFWAQSANDAVVVERSLHASFVPQHDRSEPSPTCRAYLSFLFATAAQGSYSALVAALLPCFWIYEDVGRRLQKGTELAGHPYADWVGTYGDPTFAAATERVKSIVDRLAARESEEQRADMLVAFCTAARYEWMFFDAAWRDEAWPDFSRFPPANGSATASATTNAVTDADSHG